MKITLVLDQAAVTVLLKICRQTGQPITVEAAILLSAAIAENRPRRVHRNKYLAKSLRAIDTGGDSENCDCGKKDGNS